MIEKILSNLQAEADFFGGEPMGSLQKMFYCKGVEKAIEIVQEVAKDGGWIPCSERLPEHMQQCLTTARIYFIPDHVDEPDNYIGVELNTYSKNFGWLNNTEVIAWQPLPAPYQKGE